MRERWIFAACIGLLLALTVFYPSLGWLFRRAALPDSNAGRAYEELLRKSQSLEAALAASGDLASVAKTTPGIPASVFSRYPFNFKSELLISIGARQGVHAGDAALAPVAVLPAEGPKQGIFLGKVDAVYADASLVRTIFDGTFESAVRIGRGGVDALLKGGSEPKITLIPRRADVREGDIVYTASPNVPYGVAVGTIAALAPSRDAIFNEATLALGYDINRVTAITVVPALEGP